MAEPKEGFAKHSRGNLGSPTKLISFFSNEINPHMPPYTTIKNINNDLRTN